MSAININRCSFVCFITAKKRFFSQNRIPFREKYYICPQNIRHEEAIESDFLFAGAYFALWLVRLVKVSGYAKGGTSDGKGRETIGKELQQSQVCALQETSQENQADDPKRQASG